MSFCKDIRALLGGHKHPFERRSGEVYRKHESCGTHGHSLHYVTGMCHREVERRGTRGSEDLNERAKMK